MSLSTDCVQPTDPPLPTANALGHEELRDSNEGSSRDRAGIVVFWGRSEARITQEGMFELVWGG